jgi:hypothetical protein
MHRATGHVAVVEAAGAVRESDPGALDLAGARLAPELRDELVDLGDAGRPQGCPFDISPPLVETGIPTPACS